MWMVPGEARVFGPAELDRRQGLGRGAPPAERSDFFTQSGTHGRRRGSDRADGSTGDKGEIHAYPAQAAGPGGGPARDGRAGRGKRLARTPGASTARGWLRASRAAPGARSVPTAPSTSPRRSPGGSRASTRGAGGSTTVADALPPRVIPIGGAMDVAFLGRTAYAIVTLVGSDVGGSDVVGLYRVDGRHRVTVVADVGAFAVDNPPSTPFDQPTGLQYAMEPYRGRLPHHRRAPQPRVACDAPRRDLRGRAVRQHRADRPRRGRGTGCTWPRPARCRTCPRTAGSWRCTRGRAPPRRWPRARRCSSTWRLGAGTGCTRSRRACSRGGDPGAPALPNTGSLVRANRSGGFTVLAGGLDRPTSLELIGRSAYVVTLTGEVWRLR